MATLVQTPDALWQEDQQGYCNMWETLFGADSKYIPIKPIGKGAYGLVCSSIDRDTNEKVAIKKVAIDNSSDALKILREVRILRQIRHPNVITLKDIMLPPYHMKDVYLVYDLMDTDLHKVIQSQPLSNDHIQYFLFQMLCGLYHLHSANVLHRDLKPANIFLNDASDLKIGDFGLARTVASDQLMTENVVTRWYRAPELLIGCDNYGASIDMWSVGCILAEMLGRVPIFPGTGLVSQFTLILNVLGTQKEADLGFIEAPGVMEYINSLPYSKGIPFSDLYPGADPRALDLLERMLLFDPRKRISAIEALNHPYMADLYDALVDIPAGFTIDLNLDDTMEEHKLKGLILEELVSFHPEIPVR